MTNLPFVEWYLISSVFVVALHLLVKLFPLGFPSIEGEFLGMWKLYPCKQRMIMQNAIQKYVPSGCDTKGLDSFVSTWESMLNT